MANSVLPSVSNLSGFEAHAVRGGGAEAGAVRGGGGIGSVQIGPGPKRHGESSRVMGARSSDIDHMVSNASQPLAITAISDVESTKSSPLEPSPTKPYGPGLEMIERPGTISVAHLSLSVAPSLSYLLLLLLCTSCLI